MDRNFYGKGNTSDQLTDALRIALKSIGTQMLELKDLIAKHQPDADPSISNVGEMLANITLAYRSVEDASMRLGKVIQHNNGGVSANTTNAVGDPTVVENKPSDETPE